MRLTVLTTGRQDWGILRSTCSELRARCELHVLAGGMAVRAEYGDVATAIEAEGFPVQRLDWNAGLSDIERETGAAVSAIGAALRATRPDALVLVGDRYETAAAALAATILGVPLVHLHGGEETEGAFDNALRHSISKQAHLHFVSHARYARRLVQMGEAPEHVVVSGAPGLDNLHRDDLPGRAELERFLGRSLTGPVILVAVHATTLAEDPAADARAIVTAMGELEATWVVTLPNSDPGGLAVREVLRHAPGRVVQVEALGERRFWGMLRVADAMVGNSSSALIEAPAVGLPAVNVGERQAGRLRGVNVIDVAADPTAVLAGLRQALDPSFRRAARASPAPFGDGHAGAIIAERLLAWVPPKPARKRFVDQPT